MLWLGSDGAKASKRSKRAGWRAARRARQPPRREDGSSSDVRVIGDKQPTFARVQVLVRLGAEAGDVTEGSGRLPGPARPQGVGTVLHQPQVMLAADARDRFEVGDVSAHVGQEQDAARVRLGLPPQVGEVDGQVRGGLHEDCVGTDVLDRSRHRCEGPAVKQHRVPGPDSQAVQGQVERRAAGVDPQRITPSHEIGELALPEGSLRLGSADFAITKQPSAATSSDWRGRLPLPGWGQGSRDRRQGGLDGGPAGVLAGSRSLRKVRPGSEVGKLGARRKDRKVDVDALGVLDAGAGVEDDHAVRRGEPPASRELPRSRRSTAAPSGQMNSPSFAASDPQRVEQRRRR